MQDARSILYEKPPASYIKHMLGVLNILKIIVRLYISSLFLKQSHRMKFFLSTSDDSDYICKYINTEHKQLTLYNKNNSSIVIEIFIPNDNKILLTIMNTEALGTSPRMTFIKHKS